MTLLRCIDLRNVRYFCANLRDRVGHGDNKVTYVNFFRKDYFESVADPLEIYQLSSINLFNKFMFDIWLSRGLPLYGFNDSM